MSRTGNLRLFIGASAATIGLTGCADSTRVELQGEAALVLPGVVSSSYSEVRLAISPDGRSAAWGSTNRPGGRGGWDIWLSSKRRDGTWSTPTVAPFCSAANDFDPAFSPDGRALYFFSNRAGGFGGDDIYRVSFDGTRWGNPVNLGPNVNSSGDEWAPVVSPDGQRLLFASNGRGGRGRHDLFTARLQNDGFTLAVPVPGIVNTTADEFDGTWLADGRTIVFARAPNLEKDQINLYVAYESSGSYAAEGKLSLSVNTASTDTLGPAIDPSRPLRLLFSGSRSEKSTGQMDIFEIDYRFVPPHRQLK
ncbi:MAG: hypothetical protein R3E77_14085 [Steroidobacteraceae bacterium]